MAALCPPSSSRASPATRPTPLLPLATLTTWPERHLTLTTSWALTLRVLLPRARSILFNHCLFHGTWFKWPERVYLAAKCAAQPRTAEQFRLYDDYYRIDASSTGLAGR